MKDRLILNLADLYSVDQSRKKAYIDAADHALSTIGFLGETGEGPRTLQIRSLLGNVLSDWRQLMESDMLTIARCMNRGTYGQREICFSEQSAGAGMENENSIRFTELKATLHLGSHYPANHPINELQKYSFYLPNPEIQEFPNLIPRAEEVVDLAEQDGLALYGGISEKIFGTPHYLPSILAYGESSVRLIYYPGLEDAEIIDTPIINSIHALTVRFEYKKLKNLTLKAMVEQLRDSILKNDPTNHNYEITSEHLIIKHLVRAGEHTDIDVDANLWGASTRGLKIRQKDGESFPFTAAPGVMIRNAGEFLEHLTAFEEQEEVRTRYIASPHWVDFHPDERGNIEDIVRKPRVTAVMFVHGAANAPYRAMQRTPKVLALYPDSSEGFLIRKRLIEINFTPPELREKSMQEVQDMLANHPFHITHPQIIAFEEKHGVEKLLPHREFLEKSNYLRKPF